MNFNRRNKLTTLIESKADQEKFKQWIGLDKINGKTIGEIYFDKFSNLKNSIKSPYNDIYYWMKNSTADKFKKFVDDEESKKVEKQDIAKKEREGARLVYSDNDWKVYEITNYEASAKYGKGTKWCISGSKLWRNGENGRQFFTDYHVNNGIKFYFFLNKNGEKYALAVYPNNKNCEIFNSEDVKIAFIPDAPDIDEIKVKYKDNSDANILVNAIMSGKLETSVLLYLMREVVEENTGDYCYITDSAAEAASFVCENIPDEFIEFTAVENNEMSIEEFNAITENDYTEEYFEHEWGGDIPSIDYNFIGDFKTKKEYCDSKNYEKHKYWIFKDSSAGYVYGYEVDYADDFVHLYMICNNMCGIDNWTDDDFDEFFLDEDEELEGASRADVFGCMLTNELIWKIKNRAISKSVLNGLGLSQEYIDSIELKESLTEDILEVDSDGKRLSKEQVEFFKDSRIKKNDKLLVMYHGTNVEFDEFKGTTFWTSSSEEYARQFAEWLYKLGVGNKPVIYKVYLNCKNPFMCGNTDERIYNLIPVEPYKLSAASLKLISKLGISEEEFRDILKLENEKALDDKDLTGYKKKLHVIVRMPEFIKLVMSKGYDSLVTKEAGHLCVAAFNAEDIKKTTNRRPTKSKNMNESHKAITWGDLDYAKKTDTRKMMRGRGTGHFGTGFYFVGAEGPYGIKDGKLSYDYEASRPIYEIDLDAYHLYQPKDNDSAYKIHDAMSVINNYYSPDMNKYLFSDISAEKLKDNYYTAVSVALQEDIEDDDFDFDLDGFEDLLGPEEEVSEQEKGAEQYIELAKKWIEENELTDWINTEYMNLDDWLKKNINSLGRIEMAVENAIDNREKYLEYVEYAMNVLCSEFNVDRNTLIALCKTFYNMKSEDSISTLLFKEFGYEGVDVTHLNHDAQGLSGLDNFGYGTVIYDLKPNTFRRIVEPREDKSQHFKNGESLKEDYFEGDFYEVYQDMLQYESDRPALGAAFITEDGTFINLDRFHGDIFGDEYYESDDYNVLFDEFGLIKINGGNKYEPFPYVDYNDDINISQESALINWMYYLISKNRKNVQINTDNFCKTYEFKDMLPEEILKDVHKHLR